MIIALTGCNENKTKEDKLKIVTTIFPEYDWVKNIVGECEADIMMLLDNGVDLHSYQPTTDDIVSISNCDLFIYIGGESDSWVKDALKTINKSEENTLNLMACIKSSLLNEEEKEGMQESVEDDEDEAYDEHIWLSLRNAEKCCTAICNKISGLDEANKDTYGKNLTEYVTALRSLDTKYSELVSSSVTNTLLFADRFPFLYMVKDYNLDYYAAFSGCSAESEASFATVAFLADKIDELGLKNIFVLENNDKKIANTVIKCAKSSDVGVLTLNSLQNVTASDVESGITYLDVMAENYAILCKALS